MPLPSFRLRSGLRMRLRLLVLWRSLLRPRLLLLRSRLLLWRSLLRSRLLLRSGLLLWRSLLRSHLLLGSRLGRLPDLRRRLHLLWSHLVLRLHRPRLRLRLHRPRLLHARLAALPHILRRPRRLGSVPALLRRVLNPVRLRDLRPRRRRPMHRPRTRSAARRLCRSRQLCRKRPVPGHRLRGHCSSWASAVRAVELLPVLRSRMLHLRLALHRPDALPAHRRNLRRLRPRLHSAAPAVEAHPARTSIASVFVVRVCITHVGIHSRHGRVVVEVRAVPVAAKQPSPK